MSSRIPSSLMEQMLEEQDLPQPQLTQMIIQLDSHRQCALLLGPNDDPDLLAKKFCFKHNVDPRVIPTLATNIRSVQHSLLSNHIQRTVNTMGNKLGSKQGNKKKEVGTRNNVNGSTKNSESRQSLSRQKENCTRRNGSKRHDTTQDEALNSRKLMNNSMMSQGDVFDRLYRDSSHRRPPSITQSINQSMNLNTSIQTSIYEKNRRLKDATVHRNQQLRREKEMQELQECRFKPQINEISSIIASKIRTGQPRRRADPIHYLTGRQIEEQRECTFVPKLNARNISNTLNISNVPNRQQRYAMLHQEYLHRMDTIKRHNNIQSTPKINANSDRLVRGTSFTQRLKEDQDRKSKQKQTTQREQKRLNQSRPSTGRPPRSRSRGNKPIGQYLYDLRELRKRDPQPQSPTPLQINPKSLQLYEQNKRTAFRYLFTLMDSDEDGLISGTRIDILPLSEPILKLLSPLLSEMESLELELQEEQFVAALARLFETLSVHEKHTVLTVYKHAYDVDQEVLFQPALNERSLLLAAQMREPGCDLYEISLQKEVEKEARLNEMRAIKMLQEYEECTFKPEIN